jgi:hypothetical protein
MLSKHKLVVLLISHQCFHFMWANSQKSPILLAFPNFFSLVACRLFRLFLVSCNTWLSCLFLGCHTRFFLLNYSSNALGSLVLISPSDHVWRDHCSATLGLNLFNFASVCCIFVVGNEYNLSH